MNVISLVLPGYAFSKKVIRRCLRILGYLVLHTLRALYFPAAIILFFGKIRFLTGGNYPFRIGHLALEPYCYIVTGLFGWHQNYKGILMVPAKKSVNPFFTRLWGKYFIIINSDICYYFIYPLYKYKMLQIDIKSTFINKREREVVIPANYTINKKYRQEFGGKPLLELYASDKEKGQNCLEELGVPKGAWFIALHVREGGYLQHLNYHSYRDADVKTYLTACDEVIQRGGWAIRLGDSSMKPLPTMDRVVDYAHSTFKSDWMDIFLLTQCRFILGTTSGPIAVSAIFGKPCVLTNFTPMGHGAFQYGDLWIPKLYYLNKEERMLSIKECMSKKYRGISRSENFKNAGITLIDNTNDEIRGVTIEMLNRYDGKTDYTEEDEILQENFMTELRREPLFETEARIGKDFLKKYKFLLD